MKSSIQISLNRKFVLAAVATLAFPTALTGCGGDNGKASVIPPPNIAAASGVMFDPSGKHAYALQPAQKVISQFSVNADGSLTALSPASVSAGNYPWYAVIVQTGAGTFLYVTSQNVVLQYKLNADGTLAPLSPSSVPITGAAPQAIVVDPSNKFIYVADSGGNGGVDEFKINADGTLTSIGMLSPGYLSQIVVSRDGKWMFANGNLSGGYLNVIKVNADGTLTLISGSSANAYSIFTVHPNLAVLYGVRQVNGGPYQLDAFTINGDGSLTPLGSPVSVPKILNNNLIAISPSGNAIYLPDPNGSDVAQVKVNADGSLSAMSPSTVAADGPTTAVSISPDGSHLFAPTATTVDTYKVNANGTLTKL